MLCLVVQSCPTLCNTRHSSLPSSSPHGDSPGKNTGVGSLSLLLGILLTQELNCGLLYCKQVLYQLSYQGSPSVWWLSVKESAGDTKDASLIPGLGRSPGVGNGNLLWYSCLGNAMDRASWQATVHGITTSWTELCTHAHTHIHAHTHSFDYSFTDCLTLCTINHVLILYFVLLKYRISYSARYVPSLFYMPYDPCQCLCVYEFVSVLLHLFICSFGSIYKWNHDIFFIWLIPFSIIPSRSFSIVTNGKILHFYGWVMFHPIYMPLTLYLFTISWTLRVLPYPGYCK